MALQINQYPITATQIKPGGFFDMDFEVSPGVFESQKVPSELLIDTFNVNIGNSNLSQTTAGVRKYVLLGALSTDGFSFRDSTDTYDLLKINGNEEFKLGGGSSGGTNYISHFSDGRMFFAKSGANFIELNATTGSNRLYAPNNGWFFYSGTKGVTINQGSGLNAYFNQGNFQIGNILQASTSTNSILIENGNEPTSNKQNRHWYYSKNIIEGNSAPHWRTENGDILKLYKNTALTVSDGTLANAVTRQGEIETILQNLGII